MTDPPESRPEREPDDPLPERPPCPFCDSTETELISPFGGQLTVAGYWCRGCRTGFEYIKWEANP